MTVGPSPETFVDTILALFDRRGGDHYGEAVTQLDHALQTAHHARSEGQADALVAAALLHDIGQCCLKTHLVTFNFRKALIRNLHF